MEGGLALRHDALKANLAGVGEHGRAVGLDVLFETQAGRGPLQQRCQGGLAGLERLAPQVLAIQLDQIKRVQEGARNVG